MKFAASLVLAGVSLSLFAAGCSGGDAAPADAEDDVVSGNGPSLCAAVRGNGELIGIAFDGNWEAMSGDISYEPELQRTISVDIRYVLWVIDKYAGAKHLVDEMTLVKKPVDVPMEVVPPAPTSATDKRAGAKN